MENYVIPGEGSTNARLDDLLCNRAMLQPQVAEMISLIKSKPTSVHRELVQTFLDTDASTVIKRPQDMKMLQAAMGKIFCGPNDIETNTQNPAPKDPIVLGADIIKPRIMDPAPRQNPRNAPRGLDPLDIEGKTEPFATIEVRNASMPNSPVIDTVQADKDGNFMFHSENERMFQFGDQVLVRAVDQEGAASGDALTKTCPYDLQVWQRTGRRETVELPHATDTRPPFYDGSKITTTARKEITKNAKEQVFDVVGGPMSVPQNTIIRATNRDGKPFEAISNKDGSFKLPVGGHTPGETLRVVLTDVNGQVRNENIHTPVLKFDVNSFLEQSQGVPFQKLDKSGKTDSAGPSLDFKQDAAVDPFSWVNVKNNSTGESFKTQADKNGNLDVELRNVHAGDSLAFSVEDPAGNSAPSSIENYIVPSKARPDAAIVEMDCQKSFLKEHVALLKETISKNPSAANREILDAVLGNKAAFANETLFDELSKFSEVTFTGVNNVRNHAENPAPKKPIIISAEMVRSVDKRDTPLTIEGKAEPFSTIEVRNASRPNAPVTTTVEVDKNGRFTFENSDERRYTFGDQMMLRATDQGGATSTGTLTDTCAYQMTTSQNPTRTEKVDLPHDTNSRKPFLDMAKATSADVAVTSTTKERTWNFAGAALAAEPNSIVRVTNRDGKEVEAKVNEDGSFSSKKPVVYTPGETLTVRIFDVHGAVHNEKIRTQNLRFDQDALMNSTEGVPFNRAGETGGPFLAFSKAGVVDPFSSVTLKNNSTGKKKSFKADKDGNLNFEIAGVHVGDSLSLSVQDPAKHNAPSKVTNYVVPGTPIPTKEIADTCHMQVVKTDNVDNLVDLLKQNPTAANRGMVQAWLDDGKHTSFHTASDKGKLEKAMSQIFCGKADVTSNLENHAPKDPIVLDARIIKPRVMDQGRGVDPLEITGEAEPFSTVIVRNASVQGNPVIGSVVVGEDGKFSFESTDERKFKHGDKLLVMAKDQGKARSNNTLSKTCSYELQVWNRTGVERWFVSTRKPTQELRSSMSARLRMSKHLRQKPAPIRRRPWRAAPVLLHRIRSCACKLQKVRSAKTSYKKTAASSSTWATTIPAKR
ncbi:MAG: hypothetical protein GY822_02255 [Deltaproteobacteria bacterium]|nr:hypothetical protein [Deltaproteobacteria bacterium]